jgi:hypothetical protein
MSATEQPEDIDALLAQFPGPVSIPPSRVKVIVVISALVALVAGTATPALLSWREWALLDPFNWAGLGMSAYLLALLGRMLLPGKALFTLDRQGIRIAMHGLRDREVLWREVKDVSVYKRLGRRWVCLTHRNVDAERSFFFKTNWNIQILRFDPRPMTIDGLTLLVQKWRERALASPAT